MYVARICQDGEKKKEAGPSGTQLLFKLKPKSESLILLLLLLRLAAGLLRNEHFLIAMCFSLAWSYMCAAAD